MVTEFGFVKKEADEFVLSLSPLEEPKVRSQAVEYYIRNGLADTDAACAILRESHGKDAKELNSMQAGVLSLLRAHVFDFIIETGHMDKFKATISA